MYGPEATTNELTVPTEPQGRGSGGSWNGLPTYTGDNSIEYEFVVVPVNVSGNKVRINVPNEVVRVYVSTAPRWPSLPAPKPLYQISPVSEYYTGMVEVEMPILTLPNANYTAGFIYFIIGFPTPVQFDGENFRFLLMVPSIPSVCVPTVGSRTCICPTGLYGDRCQLIDFLCGSAPCMNGGRCYNGFNRFTCDCLPGYTGEICQTDIDECVSNPCQNGGKFYAQH